MEKDWPRAREQKRSRKNGKGTQNFDLFITEEEGEEVRTFSKKKMMTQTLETFFCSMEKGKKIEKQKTWGYSVIRPCLLFCTDHCKERRWGNDLEKKKQERGQRKSMIYY